VISDHHALALDNPFIDEHLLQVLSTCDTNGLTRAYVALDVPYVPYPRRVELQAATFTANGIPNGVCIFIPYIQKSTGYISVMSGIFRGKCNAPLWRLRVDYFIPSDGRWICKYLKKSGKELQHVFNDHEVDRSRQVDVPQLLERRLDYLTLTLGLFRTLDDPEGMNGGKGKSFNQLVTATYVIIVIF